MNYYYTFYFALIMMVFIIYGLSGERDNGMWGIVHSAGSGRLRLALHRLFIIAGSGVVITAGLYFTTFAAAAAVIRRSRCAQCAGSVYTGI